MNKSLVLTLAASSLLAAGSTLCLAADVSNMAPNAAQEAAPAHSSQGGQQTNEEEQHQNDAGGDQAQTSQEQSEKQQPDEDQAKTDEPAMAQSMAAPTPAPSQRGMRQQLKDARQNQAN